MFTKCALICILINHIHVVCSDSEVDPPLGTIELIKSRGFDVELHYVTTADGHILGVHRIVNPKSPRNGLKSVILNHGLMLSSIDFLNNAPGGHFDESLATVGNNLGFELAKRGYDVWLANNRGNTYSRNHTTYSSRERAFWEFSFDEMAQFDLPATIDYVRNVTSSHHVGFVGHSQGSLLMFALLCERAEYNEIIKPFIALAPVTSVGNSTALLQMSEFAGTMILLLSLKGGQFLNAELVLTFAQSFCSNAEIELEAVCESMLFFSDDKNEVNDGQSSGNLVHATAGTSVRNMVHWIQAARSGRFAKYDYGRSGNLDIYNSTMPPEYKLEKITNKYIALFSSINDDVADVVDVDILKRRLNVPLIADYLVTDPLWKHLDFLWAQSSGQLINRRVIHLLDRTC